MKRLHRLNKTKIAMTLVELVVAMALTSLFAMACIMLILPVEKIYMRTTDVSRAQFLADTIVDSLRAECSKSYITGKGDVWIGNIGNETMEETPSSVSDSGPVLVFHKNTGYCETIFANGMITESSYNEIQSNDEAFLDKENITSRAVYRLFASGTGSNTSDTNKNYVHFGYYLASGGNSTYITPTAYYDFTNPFSSAAYRGFNVDLTFSDIGYNSEDIPSYVLCRIDVKENDEIVYTRNAVLCFAGPAQ